MEGSTDGSAVGIALGIALCLGVGEAVGSGEGNPVGKTVGRGEGTAVGEVGILVGFDEGIFKVKTSVIVCVGCPLQVSVFKPPQFWLPMFGRKRY